MGYTVRFLGEEYSIPEAIKEYLNYEKLVLPVVKKLLDLELANIQRDAENGPSNWISAGESDVMNYQAIIRDTANALVKELLSKGVYDVTLNDLIGASTAYTEIHDHAVRTMLKALEEGRRFVELKQQGMERAYSYAARNITGSGVRIFTSSFALLMIHSALEYSLLQKQAKEADAEYQAAVVKLNAQISNGFDKMCKDIMIGEYYPGLIDIFLKSYNEIMAAFLSALTVHGKFDFDSISSYDMAKADDMLCNIDMVPDKKAFLKECFIKCPFSPSIYAKCFDLGLMDVDTYMTAQYLDATASFADRIEPQCRAAIGDSDRFDRALGILMAHRGIDRKQAILELYNERITRIKTRYIDLENAMKGGTSLVTWIRDNIANTASFLCAIDEIIIKDKINNVLSEIITPELYTTFDEADLLHDLCIPVSANGLSETNRMLSEQITPVVIDYINQVRSHREACLAEYESLNSELKKCKSECETKRSEMSNELGELQANRNSLGLFAFQKKKEADQAITNLKNRIASIEASYNIETLKKECAIKRREADQLVI